MKGKYILATYRVQLEESTELEIQGESCRIALGHEFLIGNSELKFTADGHEDKFALENHEEIMLPGDHLVILANLGLQAIKDLNKKGIKFKIKDGDVELL